MNCKRCNKEIINEPLIECGFKDPEEKNYFCDVSCLTQKEYPESNFAEFWPDRDEW